MGKNIVKALTKANIKAYGIERAPQHDFNDDGNHFRGFIYKGMPMTQCYAKSDGEVYLSIRVDYLKNNFTFTEWMKTEEYTLTKEFNGTSEIDMDKLIENLERIIAKRDELNSNVKISEEDILRVKCQIWQEVSELEGFVNTVKSNLQWWKLKGYDLGRAADYVNTISNRITEGNKSIDGIKSLSVVTIKEFIETINAGRKIYNCDFYISQLTEMMNK